MCYESISAIVLKIANFGQKNAHSQSFWADAGCVNTILYSPASVPAYIRDWTINLNGSDYPLAAWFGYILAQFSAYARAVGS